MYSFGRKIGCRCLIWWNLSHPRDAPGPAPAAQHFVPVAFDRRSRPPRRLLLPPDDPAAVANLKVGGVEPPLIDEKIRANTKAVLDVVRRTAVLPRAAATSPATERVHRAMRTRRWDAEIG
jgi:hypothetical protein